MEQHMLQRFQQKLLEEKSGLLERIDHMNSTLEDTLSESISELSTYDNHPADIGEETFERSKDFALREKTRIHLAEVNEALQRIEEGTYGICKECGKEIPLERLEAMPAATQCKDCKITEEHLPDRHPRPLEEDVIAPPYGMKSHDNSQFELGDAEDELEFDGEDAWQTVAKWGTSNTPQDISVNGITDYDHMYVDADENIGTVERVEQIPYEKGLDGMFYQDFDGQDDEIIQDNPSLHEKEDTELDEKGRPVLQRKELPSKPFKN